MLRTQEEVEAEALRLAQSVVDYDRADEERRIVGHNRRRINRLDLGEVILDAPDPDACARLLIKQTSLTKAEVEDIVEVTNFNLQSGASGWLRSLALSFTQNRMLTGRKVKIKEGHEMPPVSERLDALQRCLERNEGRFKEDAEFRNDLSVLVAPNSVENIIERAEQDPEFRQELEAKGVFVTTQAVVDAVEAEAEEPKLRIDPWVKRMNDLRSDTTRLRDQVFDDPDAPAGLYDYAGASIEDLQAIRSIISGRRDMQGGV